MSRGEFAVPRSVRTERAFRRILLVVDAPRDSGRAIEVAIRLAGMNRAQLIIVHVEPTGVPLVAPMGLGPPVIVPRLYFEAERERKGRQTNWLARLVEVAEARGVRATMDVIDAQGSIAEEVTKRAYEEQVDLVVIAEEAPGLLARLVRGTLSAAITESAECPVLVARGPRSVTHSRGEA